MTYIQDKGARDLHARISAVPPKERRAVPEQVAIGNGGSWTHRAPPLHLCSRWTGSPLSLLIATPLDLSYSQGQGQDLKPEATSAGFGLTLSTRHK